MRAIQESAGARGILKSMDAVGPYTDEDESRLIEAARGGDRESFEHLVRLHMPRVWRVVWRVVRHREDAEDGVQEVFLTAFRSLGEYRGDCAFSSWLHRIAVTRALNHLDRASEKVRRSSVPLVEADGAGNEARGAAPHHPLPHAQGVSPLQALEAGELMRRLADCLSRLPATLRAVLTLRDGEDLPYDEIAKALELNIGTVRSRLARGRMALRECIEGH